MALLPQRMAFCAWMAACWLAVASSLPARAQSATKTAADLVPADCTFFESSLRLKEQWDAVAQSRAVAKAWNLPLVQLGLMQLQGMPQYRQAMQWLETPLAQDLVAFFKDAHSQEQFIYGEKGWVDFGVFLQEMVAEAWFANLMAAATQSEPQPLPVLITALTQKKDFAIPALVIGHKITNKERPQRLLGMLRGFIDQAKLPVKAETRQIGAGDYLVVRITFKDLPISKEQFVANLEKAKVSEIQAENFYEWLQDRALEIDLGIAGDYFIFSIASDSSHLEKLGHGPSLGASPRLNPIRKHLSSDKVIALSYTSLELAQLSRFDAADTMKSVEGGLAAVQLFLPPGLADRLTKDLKELLTEIEASQPVPSESVSVSLFHRGVESYSYSKSVSSSIDYSRPISVIRHAGGQPILAAASSATSSKHGYERLVYWGKKLYGYWREFGAVRLGPEQQAEYKKFEAILLPFLAKVDTLMREKFLPATDACQSMLVLDGKLMVKDLGPELQLPQAMPLPEIAIVATLNDGKQFAEGMRELAAEIEKLIVAMGNATGEREMQAFRIPPPTVENVFGGKRYYYPLPPVLDPAILPHAYLSEKLLVLSISPSLTERVVSASSLPADTIAGADQPSGSLVMFRTATLWSGITRWFEFAMEHPEGPAARARPNEKQMVKQHAAAVFDLLRTIKGIDARSYREGDYIVTHSWFHVEDIP